MARQPIAAKVPTSKFPRFCRWARSSSWRPPLCSIHMDWELGLPILFQRRRAQLTRLLHNPAFQRRSGNTLQYLRSAAGVDFDGIDPGIYPNLLSLWLEGPLPDTTLLPPSLENINIRGSEATQDSAEWRLLTQQRTPDSALPQLGPQLLHCPRLVVVTLSHYNVDGLAQLLPPLVRRLGVLYCSITMQPDDPSHDGWLARSLAAKAVAVSSHPALCPEGVGLIHHFKSTDRLLASAPQ